MIKKLKIMGALVALPCSVWAMAQLHVPVDTEARKQAEVAVREVQQDHDSAASIRAYRRWLEFYPNEPSVQAGIYRAMSIAFAQDGNEEQATIWSRAAELDPVQDGRVASEHSNTRGATDKLAALLAAVNQTAQTVQTLRQTFNAAHPNPAMPGVAQAFPQQPVGSPGFQPTPVTQPMPGYAPAQPQFAPPTAAGQPQPIPLDPQGNPIQQPVPQQPMQPVAMGAQGNSIQQPVPQPIAPMQPQAPQMQPVIQQQPQQPQQYQQPAQQYQPQPQPQQYQPQQQYQQPQQQYQQQPAQQYQQPQQYPQQSQQQYPQQSQRYAQPAQYQQQYRQPPPYAQPRMPYGAPAGYARGQQARRGSAGAPIKVFHDHSRLGDANYFEPTCGALLLVENGSLTFTPAGGENSLVIPVSEIIEIRMNTLVAKEAGAFHIITKSGLYLALAPAGATAEEGRADMEELRKQLGLDQ